MKRTKQYAKRRSTTGETKLEKKIHRRHQSKLNQRRYRIEQKEHIDYLEGTVADLTTEVARLEGRLDSLRMTVPRNLQTLAAETNIANEYFRIFANGYAIDPTSPMRKYQHEFLTSVMDQDLVFMDSTGIDKLFHQWGLYVKTFASVRMECVLRHVVALNPHAMLEANAIMHLRISRETIQLLSPHLLCNEPLVQKLVGRVMKLMVVCQFTFDRNLKIQQFNTIANPVAGLMEILHDVDETALIMSGLLISQTGELAPVDMDVDER
ncbi:hypothetical protein LEN26_011181 [Aphanomyces euteiches]|nr:hypothetical protein AeMF1_012217 [Aphanomyces euteiches]KAH9120276.1 hypothetical protein LEN26_011181 [Aphanomyces euteiches]KAH9195164.1 hypothetical protein AeNC1_002857 [Aphanomyces euteiches]